MRLLGVRKTAAAVAASIAMAASVAGISPSVAIGLPSGVVTGFDMPESVVWDARTDAWYVSNFGSNSGGGFIAKLPRGATEPEVFATGLTSPQGIIIEDSTMYAADGDTIRVIDMDDPTSQQAIVVEGAAFGDLDVDPATGDIYAGDLGASTVWRIRDGVGEVWTTINSPDGIYLSDGGLYAATFALGGPGGVFRIDLETKVVTTVAEIPLAFLDGLEKDGDGWLITDFVRGQLSRVAADGTSSILAQLGPSAADLGFDPVTRTALVPELLLNVAVFVSV